LTQQFGIAEEAWKLFFMKLNIDVLQSNQLLSPRGPSLFEFDVLLLVISLIILYKPLRWARPLTWDIHPNRRG
jgi:hypothetical protein